MFEEINICGNNSGPDLRDIFLKRAKQTYENGDIGASVTYQTKALSIGFNSRFHFNGIADVAAACLQSSINKESFETKRNPLVNYAFNFVQEHHKNEFTSILSENNFMASSIDESEIQIKKICKDFPVEWSIVQICKCHNDSTTISNFFDDLSSTQDIFISILKHARSLEYPEPICIKIKIDAGSNLFQDFGSLSKLFKSYSTFNMDKSQTSEDKEKFWKGMDCLENKIKDIIQRFKDEIGPWVFLLSGNIQKQNAKGQKRIYDKIDKFCDKKGLDNTKRVLISLMVPFLASIPEEMLKSFSKYLADDVRPLAHDIHNFILSFELNLQIFTFSPCLLILDEKIDHFCWEILNEDQDFCRISSFLTLFQLYEKYKSQIANGFIKMSVKKGCCTVNPEKNLTQMEGRMNRFFDYWLPHWDCTYGVHPTQNSIIEILNSTDCYVYCGHGCGLQYINGHKISKMEINCVVFLFGCNSVRMRSNGLHSEMTASHIYYHAALCPAVIGTLLIGLDFQMDILATRILSTWLKSDATTHWSSVNLNTWRKGSLTFNSDVKKPNETHDKSLPSVVTKNRNWKSQKLYNRIGFVYRGLPVWNAA